MTRSQLGDPTYVLTGIVYLDRSEPLDAHLGHGTVRVGAPETTGCTAARATTPYEAAGEATS